MGKNSKAESKGKLVSVVIPTYKAEKFIRRSLLKVKNVLDQTRYQYEIICVIDGRVDKSYEEAEEVSSKFSRQVKVIGYAKNLGKGHAVRYGMAKARGDIIGFIDAGFDLNPNGLMMLLEHFEWYNADIIVGSKRHPASKVIYPWQRRVLSLGFQILVRVLFGLRVRDTQVGMKFFKREVLEKILPRLLVKEWAFDVEMLAVAHHLGFERIYEAPVELKLEFGGVSVLTSKGFLKTVFRMLWDTVAVFYRLRILKYYEDKNSKNWVTSEYLKLS